MRRFYKQAFQRDLALAALAAAPDWPPADGGTSEQSLALRAAWDAGDVAAFIVLARRLAQAGDLKASHAARFGRRLLQLGLYEEALELAEGPMAPPQGEGAWQRVLALAGAGRVPEAIERAAEARRNGLVSEDLTKLEALLRDRAPGAAEVDWALTLGQVDLAVDGLCGLFRAGMPEGDELVEALDLARAAFRFTGPDQGARLLDAIGPLYRKGEDRDAYRSVRRVLEGGEDDDVQMFAPPALPVRHRLGYILAAACAAHRAWPAAIRRFGRAVARLERQDEHFHELARCAEADLRTRNQFRLAPPAGRRRIIDVSPFNGEFTLLDIKLHEMADWVDTFVIYEARRTYTGLEKPLYFTEGRERLAPFTDKIIHFVIDETPPYAKEAWARELCQRARAVTGLSGLIGPDDLVMLTDTDEVLDRQVVEAFDVLYTCCGLRTFCWFLNYRLLNPVKQGAKSCLIRGRFLPQAGTALVRLGMGSLIKDILPEAGWHFTSVLTAEALKIKLDSYSHEEWAGSSVARQEAFLGGLRDGAEYPGYVRQPLDASFPRYIRDHREALAEFIL
jgi:hypothetical protein